jgi:ABC-type Fe3+/spermidine/putrescine transport system ATPase subunit
MPEMNQPHVRIRKINKAFGRVQALFGVSLDIPRGSFTTFLGPSGCGKTTLLRTIAGLYEPDAGTIDIGGRLVNGTPSHLRGAVMVFQDYALFPHLSAEDNIAYGLKVKRLPGPEIGKRVSRIAAYLSVEELLSRRPAQLSGGQQQRVALARALVMEPEVLLLDEPLSNLDARLRETIRAELRRMQKSLRITTIYVTHDQTEALSMSDQVVVMDHGRVIQVGPPREVYFAPVNRFVASFVGTANLLDARVAETSSSHIICDADGVRLRAQVPGTSVEPGARVVLSVRPEHVLCWPDGAPEPAADALWGIVVSSSFEGARTRSLVTTWKHDLVLDEYSGGTTREPGARVALRIAPEHVHVMRDSRNA